MAAILDAATMLIPMVRIARASHFQAIQAYQRHLATSHWVPVAMLIPPAGWHGDLFVVGESLRPQNGTFTAYRDAGVWPAGTSGSRASPHRRARVNYEQAQFQKQPGPSGCGAQLITLTGTTNPGGLRGSSLPSDGGLRLRRSRSSIRLMGLTPSRIRKAYGNSPTRSLCPWDWAPCRARWKMSCGVRCTTLAILSRIGTPSPPGARSSKPVYASLRPPVPVERRGGGRPAWHAAGPVGEPEPGGTLHQGAGASPPSRSSAPSRSC